MHSAYKKDQDIQKNVRDILTFYAMQEDTREDRHQFWQDRARQLLGWTAHKTLEDMCRDGWNFAKRAMEA